MICFGSVPAGSVLPIMFTTYAGATGASATLTGLAVTDIEVYKGTSMTQRASDAGYTLLDTDGIDIDSITGLHGFSIDTGDNTDSGFYAAGSFYTVVVSAVTVDSQTVNFIAATFRLAPAESVAGTPKVDVSHAAGTAWASGAITAASLATDAVDEIVDGVWDETLTGSNHNTATSAGRRLRELSGGIVTSGTAQAGGTASITLASAASSTDGTYDPALVRITGGTGVGQARLIIQYVGSTRVASVDRDWRVTPDNTSTYEVVASPNLISTNEGLAQGGAASSITLNANASSVDNVYVGQSVVLRTGTGQDQVRIISAYNGTTKVASVSTPWEVQPVSGTGYIIWPIGRSRVTSMEADVITSSALAASAASEVATAVRTELTTELGRIDVATSTRLASASYTAPLDAAGTRAAVGLASANLDTQLDALPTAAENAYAVLDDAVEGSVTLRQAARLWNSALGGKAAGLETTSATYRDLGDTKNRITATVDADGNRTAVTLDLT